MMRGGIHSGVKQYQQVGMQMPVHDASPHQLIQMMFDGALQALAAARGALQAGEISARGEHIGKAIDLVEGLRISLDMERGGDLAQNLAALYDYMARRLLEANMRGDDSLLVEVTSLLRELNTGWQELGELLVRHATDEVR